MKSTAIQTIQQERRDGRTCMARKQFKLYIEFYKDATMKSGYRARCKACVRIETARHRELNPERVRIIGRRSRDKVRDQWATQRKRYIETHQDKVRTSRRNYYLHGRNLAKDRARQQLRDAIRAGTITRGPCEKCGTTPSQAHHPDFSKPFEVTWLCRPCHHAHHATERNLSRDLSTAPLVRAVTGGAQ